MALASDRLGTQSVQNRRADALRRHEIWGRAPTREGGSAGAKRRDNLTPGFHLLIRPGSRQPAPTDHVRGCAMNRFLHGVARAAAESFALPAPVLALGADPVPADDAELPQADASIGTVMALGAFER